MNNPQKNHSTRLLKAIAQNLNIQVEQIMDLELELFDHQPAQVFGLDSELLSVPRCDDKLCSYAAMEALLNNSKNADFIQNSGTISLVFLADNEEVGSKTRQGAASNILPNVIERIVGVMNARQSKSMHNLLSMTYGKSFLISADVTHAVNPNFVGAYEHNMMPRLNVGPVISCDPNAHMTTDAPGKVILQMIADKVGSKLQLFQIRNGQPSGGTIGPMLSAATGVRALDLGIRKANCTERTKSDFLAQLSMHSIRATTGSDDPGLGVKYFEAYFMHFEEIEKEVIVD